jgi:hypothetical protein
MTNNQQLIEHAILSLAAGKEDTARRLLVNLVATDPLNQQGWLYLAATLPPDKAVQALRRVLLLDPQHPIALRNLQKLRTHPGMHLDLADVIANEDIFDEATLAPFGEEPPTIFQPELFKNLPKPLNVISMSTTETAEIEEISTVEAIHEFEVEPNKPVTAPEIIAEKAELIISVPRDMPVITLKPDKKAAALPIIQMEKPEKIEEDSYLISSTFGASDSSASSAGLSESTTHRYTWLKNQAPLKYPQAKRYKGPQRTHSIFTGFGVIVLVLLLLLVAGCFYFVIIPG